MTVCRCGNCKRCQARASYYRRRPIVLERMRADRKARNQRMAERARNWESEHYHVTKDGQRLLPDIPVPGWGVRVDQPGERE